MTEGLVGRWHDAIVELFEIDLSTMGEGYSGVYRFTNEALPEGGSISMGGQSYTSIPIEASGFEVTVKGSTPQPRLTIANVLGTMSAVVGSAEDLVGAKVTRRRMIANGGPEFPEDVYYITRKVAESNLTITFELGSRVDLEGLRLPKRIITQDYCVWRYKGPECGYGGGPVGGGLTGESPEAQAYVAALNARTVALGALRSAEAELAAAQQQVNAVCRDDLLILERSEPKFNLRRSVSTEYSFVLTNNGTYFAAYNENVLVPRSAFEYLFGQTQEGDAVFGENQSTGRAPTNSGSGPIYAINRWGASYDGNGALIEVFLIETMYNPPSTFGFYDIESNPVICVDGTIRPFGEIKLETAPGQQPPDLNGQAQAFALGPQKLSSTGPTKALQIWEKSSGQCDAAQARLEAAQEALDEAQDAADAAQDALDVVTGNLPPGDPIFSQDSCGKSVNDCRLRFSAGPLPFGGFPGANVY